MPYGSVTAETFVLASVFGSSKRSGAPATCYIGVAYQSSSLDIEVTLGTAPAIGTGGYARVAFDNTDTNWGVASGAVTNNTEIRFPVSTAAWSQSPVNQWAIFDAASAGTCWAFGGFYDDSDAVMSVPMDAAGRTLVIPAGNMTLTQAA